MSDVTQLLHAIDAGDRTRHAVGVWDVGTRLELVRLEAEGFHRHLGASPDGNLLVAGVEEETLDGPVKELRLWRAPSWEEIQRAEAARQQ